MDTMQGGRQPVNKVITNPYLYAPTRRKKNEKFSTEFAAHLLEAVRHRGEVRQVLDLRRYSER